MSTIPTATKNMLNVGIAWDPIWTLHELPGSRSYWTQWHLAVLPSPQQRRPCQRWRCHQPCQQCWGNTGHVAVEEKVNGWWNEIINIYIYIQYGSLNYKCMVGWWWYVSKIHMAGGFVLVWVEGIVLVYHSLDLASSGTENRISSSDGVGWQCTAATVVDHLCRQLRWRKAYVGYVKGARIWVYDMMVIYFYNVIYHTHI